MKKFSCLMALLLAFTFLIPGLVQPASADSDPVKYWLSGTVNVIDSMITKEMWDNSMFKNQYLKTNGGSNLVNHFFLEGSRNIKSGHDFSKHQRLYFGDTYEHVENKKEIWYGDYRFKLSPFTKDTIANGGVELYLEAQLNPDNHMHILNHKDKLNDRAAIKAYSFDYNGDRQSLGQIINNNKDPNRVFTLHRESFSFSSSLSALQLQLQSTTCGCGSSKIRDTVVALVDSKAPEIKNAFIGDSFGTRVNYLTSGATAYAILEFTEPIRFADHANPATFTINLDLYDTELQSSLDDKFEATLHEVRNNKLWFKFTVPDKLSDGKAINAYISSISASQPNLIHNEADFILSALADEKKIDQYENVSSKLTTFNNYILEGAEDFGVNRARSPITDLAGNSVNWKGVIPISRTYLDGVAPKLEDFELALTDNAVASYAGVGSKIELSAFFSEEMKFVGSGANESDIKATLNINKNGNPIIIKGSKLQTVSIGTNRPPVSKLTFESLEIEKDMSCIDGRVKVVSLTIPDVIRDKSGNKVEGEAIIPVAKQEVKLDVTAPTVTCSSMGTDSGADLAYQITINDSDSGVLGGKGQFAWLDKSSEHIKDNHQGSNFEVNNIGKTFLYAITDSSVVPTEEKYKQATISDKDNPSYISFNQLEGNHYLYIKLPVNSDVLILDSEINLIVSDRAYNKAAKTIDLKEFKTDKEAPKIEFGDHYFTQEDEEMLINIPVYISDKGGIAEVKYTWGAGDPDTAISGFNITTAFSGIISQTVTAGVYEETSSIRVKAIDLSENESDIKTSSYTYDTTVATSNLGLQREPKDMTIIGPSLYIDRPIVGGAWDGATTAIMVKNPFADEESNKYFVSLINSEGSSLKVGDEYQDYFENYRDSDFWNSFTLNDWYSAEAETVTGSVYGRDGYKLSNITALNNSISSGTKPNSPTDQFAAMFGQVHSDKTAWHYYGEIQMEVITVIGHITMSATPELTNHPSKTSFTMRSADPAAYSYLYETKIGDIEKHEIQGGKFETNRFRPDIYGLDSEKEFNKDKEPGKEPVTLSLEAAEGLQIPFTISKNTSLPFGYEDIDEANSYMALYYTGHELSVMGNNFPSTAAYYKPNAGQQTFVDGVIKEVVKAPIYARGNEQYLTISVNDSNIDKYETGYYVAVANIVTKSGKNVVKQDLLLSNLFIDCYVPEELDVSSVAGRYHFLDSMSPDIIHVAEEGQSLIAPVGEDTSWNVSVGYSPEYERKGELYYSVITNITTGGRGNADIDMTDMLWVKMWNPDVTGSEANALWQHVSRDYMLKFVDADEDLQKADYYEENGKVAYLPVIYGEKNIILYQICSYNGVPGGTKQFTLVAAGKDDRPRFDLTLNPDTPDKIVTGIIATPRNVQSKVPLLKFGAYTDEGRTPNLIYSKILDEYGFLKDDLNSIPDLPIDSNEEYNYYILDEYGMAGTKSVTIDNVDSELKSINVDADKSTPDNIVKFTATVEDDHSLDQGYLTLEFWGPYTEVLSSHFTREIYEDPQGYDEDCQFITIPIPLLENFRC